MIGVLIRRDVHTGTQNHMKTQTREENSETEAGTGVMHLLTKEGQGSLANTRSKEARKDSPL